jgi:hypothetical protein
MQFSLLMRKGRKNLKRDGWSSKKPMHDQMPAELMSANS